MNSDLTVEINDLIWQLEAEAAKVRALIPLVSDQLRYLIEGNLKGVELYTKHPALPVLIWGLSHFNEASSEEQSMLLQRRAEWLTGARTQLETLQMLEQTATG